MLHWVLFDLMFPRAITVAVVASVRPSFGYLTPPRNGFPLDGVCSVGAVIDNEFMQAAFLMFDRVISYRARLTEGVTLNTGLQCLDGSLETIIATDDDGSDTLIPAILPTNQFGLRFGVLQNDYYNTSTCGPPLSIFSGFNTGLATKDIASCSPENYASNPWTCSPGDWSGKYGAMDLGLNESLYKTDNRFLANYIPNKAAVISLKEDGERPWSSSSSSSRPPYILLKEEFKLHFDPLAIPPCFLEGKMLGVFCADGRLAGCTPFKVLSRGTVIQNMYSGMKFISETSPLGGCKKKKIPPVIIESTTTPNPNTDAIETDGNEEPLNEDDDDDEDDDIVDQLIWTNINGWKEMMKKKMPDQLAHWWEEMRRKGDFFWNS